ncbi:MAG: hypothetical protein JKY34_12990 [Kordiimonadaceae bacterium]|nr:hypothetical protein [Kordiimonadaceae bacterium]
MKDTIIGWLRAARSFFAARLTSVGRFFVAQFHSRPVLKRGLFALGLFASVGVPAAVIGVPVLAVVWAGAVFTLFLGMGAERASLEWGPVIALPPARSFAFWRWHTLEKKRFFAVLVALAVGLLVSLGGGLM